MENQTRFDLNAAIENWRQELVAQPSLASDARRELETHLRDAIAGLQQRGLNDEESFWLARRRVGQPHQLGEEFVKADPARVWRERVFWTVVAIFVIQLCSQTVSFFWFSSRGYLLGKLYRLLPSVKGGSHTDLSFLTFLSLFESSSRYLPLLSFVLVMGLIMSFPRERLNQCVYKFELLFKSRLRFLLTFAAFFPVYFLFLLNFALRGNAFYEGDFGISTSAPIKILTVFGIEYAIFPTILATLIIWLMPVQNRKTPKRA